MPAITVASGSSANVALGADDILKIDAAAGGSVLVECVSGLGLRAGDKISQHGGLKTFGGFGKSGVVKIAAIGALVSYEVNPVSKAPVVTESPSAGGLYDVNGSLVSGAGFSAITNLGALKPFARTLVGATASEVYITATGDSLIQLGGDTANQSSDTLAERDGFLAQLRAQLNASLGTPDGGQWIAVEAAPSDTRVANSTSPATTPVNQFGPYNAYRNSSGTIVQRRAMALQSTGMNITFNVVGRYLDVEIWENAGTYVGTATWTVDGSGGGTINSNGGGGATDTYRTVRLDLGTDAAHTVVISWASGNTMITGATVTRGRGVVTRRFGYGGSKASTWVGLTAKQTRTSFQTLTTHLHIIRFSYNDWNNQVGDGLTIAQFQANIQTLINAALANASVKAVLLVADPPTSTADNKPISYRAFADAMKALAVGQVAFFDVDVATNSTFSAGNSAGYYVDFVHRSGAGNAAETRALAEVLTSSSLLTV